MLTAWHGMAEYDLLPDRPVFKHYMWVLFFMVVYLKSKAALCAHLGGCDPKTARAKMWPCTFALNALSFHVVSYVFVLNGASNEQARLTSGQDSF